MSTQVSKLILMLTLYRYCNKVYRFISPFFLITLLSGQTAFTSLDIPYHFRSVGMSGSGVADLLSADVSNLNPALLSGSKKALSLSGIQYPAFIRTHFVEWRTEWNKWYMSSTFKGVNYGDFLERDINGLELGKFSARDAWISFAFARKLAPIADIGFSTGFFQSRIGELQALLGLITFGTRVIIPEISTSLGVTIRNIGVDLDSYTSYKEDIPTSITIGLTHELRYLPLLLSADGFWWRDKSLLKIGGAFSISKDFFLYLGTSSVRNNLQIGRLWKDITSGFSMGLGYDIKKMSLGLSLANNGVGGIMIGLGFSRKLN